MARYFLDTGALLGITFLHDLWRSEAERLFETDNTLYTSRAVVYEYCNNDDSNSLETADVDWRTEEGRFGQKFSKVRAAQVNLDLKLRTHDDDELNLETLVNAFISETGIEDEVYPSSKIDEYIRPNVRAFLADEIDGGEITCEVARKAMDTLCDTIQTEARETRERLRRRLKQGLERQTEWESTQRRLEFIDGYMDRVILCDASYLQDEGILEKVITADRTDIYESRKRIDTVLGLTILFIKDEFADHSFVQNKSDSMERETE